MRNIRPHVERGYCKNCLKLRRLHEDWIATGEYAYKVVCPTNDMDSSGRFTKLDFFEPLDNLGYLALKHKSNLKKRNAK